MSSLPTASRSLERLGRVARYLFLGTIACLTAHAQQLEPGLIISNQASALVVDPDAGGPVELLSNTVSASVDATPGLQLTPNNSVRLQPGSQAYFLHVLRNDGNARAAYNLDFENLSENDFDLFNTRLILDVNENALPDSGEPVIDPSQDLFLEPGASLQFVLTGNVPNAVPSDSASRIRIVATQRGSDLTASVIDEVLIGSGSIQVFKTGSAANAVPGDIVSYTLTAQNGALPLQPTRISIDGAVTDRVVFRDVVPRNTRLIDASAPASLQILYHLAGTAEPQAYTTTRPADLSRVDAVAFAAPLYLPSQRIVATLDVQLAANASGAFQNTAVLHHGGFTPGDDTPTEVTTNPVDVTVPIECPKVELFSDETFTRTTEVASLGSPLLLQIDAAILNVNPQGIDRVTLEIESEKTGDFERFENYVETGPNTGIFRREATVFQGETTLGIPTQGNATTTSGDGVLQTAKRDTLTATVSDGCANVTSVIRILIDPAGIVFDSRTGAPLAGATVTLIDVTGAANGGNPGGPATVFRADGITPSPSTLVTGADGAFEFPRVGESRYRLAVTPAGGYTFPSIVPTPLIPDILSVGPARILTGSRGETFPVNQQTGAVFLDVPLDTVEALGFNLAKTASRDVAQVGETVRYQLTLTNANEATLLDVVIRDLLPAGFRYQAGSTRIDGQAAPDPTTNGGAAMIFELGDLPIGKETLIEYRARIGIGAERGDGINRAQAISRGPPELLSNQAIARVRIDQGVFTDRGVIFGKVFVDHDDDTVQDDDEPGVPGIRILLEDGTYAITDLEGKYSIYGQRAITHVVKLDRYTLPVGATLGVIDTRNTFDPDSRLADLRKGELHKANFRIVAPTPEVLDEIELRRSQAAVYTAEIEFVLSRQINIDGKPPVTDPRALPASGTLTPQGTTAPATKQAPIPFAPLLSERPEKLNALLEPTNTGREVSLETLARLAPDSEPGFLLLKDNDTVARSHQRILVKGRLGASFALRLNGREIPATRVGRKLELSDVERSAWEFVNIKLSPGANQLSVTQIDPFGNPRGQAEITVFAPDKLGRISILPSDTNPIANGITPTPVKVTLTDNFGRSVTSRTPVTLEADIVRWQVEDLDLQMPGIQTFINDGSATFQVLPPDSPATAQLRVSSGALEANESLSFLPDLRPLVASGIIQGRIHFRDLGDSGISPAFPEDGFEEELRSFHRHDADDRRASYRAAFYLKGKIRGDMLLTAAYDSDRNPDEELFRDIDPEKYYPVYGDASVRGFDAQSSGKTYVRIDKDRAFALWGDFSARSETPAVDLGDYNRSFNGLNLHAENERGSWDLWGSYNNQRQIVAEIPANGTSGPFDFSAADGILNSETVEIVTRSRNQPSLILETTALARHADYEFEPFTGRILLRRPVPSFDRELNPLSIRITFEARTAGGDKSWTYGARGQYKLNDTFEIGATYAKDENPQDAFELFSGNLTVQLAENATLTGEYAQTDSQIEGDGSAYRFRYEASGQDYEANFHWGKADTGFHNPTAGLTAGRIDGGGEYTHRFNERWTGKLEAVHTEDALTEGRRQGIRLLGTRTFQNSSDLTFGLRASDETSAAATEDTEAIAPNEVLSLSLRASAPVPRLPDARAFIEFENDIEDTDKRRVAAGGDYQINAKTRLFAHHEFISSLGGEFQINEFQQNNRTAFGLETEYLPSAYLFNEYRVRDAIDGQQAENAIGLRNDWQLENGLRLGTSYERIVPLSGDARNESTSATAAVEYLAEARWKTSARLEYRSAVQQDTYLSSLGYARKLDTDWTLLSRALSYQIASKTDDGQDLTQFRALIGLAWRQTEIDKWSALFKYEFKHEDGATRFDTAGTRRNVHLLSLATNYQPSEDWLHTHRIAAKSVSESDAFWSDSYAAVLIGGRTRYDLNDRWDIGLNYTGLWQDDLKRLEFGVGPEVGFNLKNQLRIGAGYNLWGYADLDFDPRQISQQGFYLSLTLKFDEDSLTRFGGEEKEAE